MAHHQADVLLGVVIKGRSFRTYLPDIFMVFLTMGLLPGAHGITVIDTGTDDIVNAAFQLVRMLELAAAVGQNHLENIAEQVSPNGMVNGIKHGFHMAGFLTIQQVSHHKTCGIEMPCKQHLVASLTSDNRIHFHDTGVRVQADIFLVILISPAFKNATVADLRLMDTADLVNNLFWKIQVAHRKGTLINVVVECLFTLGDFRMAVEDRIRGLTLLDQGADDSVQDCQAFLGNIDSGTGFHQNGAVLLMGSLASVIRLIQPTARFLRAGIAYKRCLVQFLAMVIERDVIGAMGKTAVAAFALSLAVCRGRMTDVYPVAGGHDSTSGQFLPIGVMWLHGTVFFDLLGDCRRIFVDFLCNCFEGFPCIKPCFNCYPVFQSHVFLVSWYLF